MIISEFSEYVLKAKSNFTLFIFEYIYTRSDFKANGTLQLAFNTFPCIIHENDLCKKTLFRVTCAFIKHTKSAFSHKMLDRLEIKTSCFEGHQLSIQNTARNFVMHVWLVFGSMLKLVYVENVSL